MEQPDVSEQPTPPQFPMTQFNITPQGLSITILLGPALAISHLIDTKTMDKLARSWIEAQVEVKKQEQQRQHVIHMPVTREEAVLGRITK